LQFAPSGASPLRPKPTGTDIASEDMTFCFFFSIFSFLFFFPFFSKNKTCLTALNCGSVAPHPHSPPPEQSGFAASDRQFRTRRRIAKKQKKKEKKKRAKKKRKKQNNTKNPTGHPKKTNVLSNTKP
jgi:hypothetical protein